MIFFHVDKDQCTDLSEKYSIVKSPSFVIVNKEMRIFHQSSSDNIQDI